MDAFGILAIVVIALVLLGIAAVTFGVDSRDSIDDAHDRAMPVA